MPPSDRERQEDERLRRRSPEQALPIQQEPSSRDRFSTSPDRGRIGQPSEREPLRDRRSSEPPRFGAGEPAGRDGDKPRERLQWSGPKRLDEVKRGRVERVEDGRRVIEEPGNRVIIREKDRIVIRRDEGRAFQRYNPNARTRDLSDGRRETWFERLHRGRSLWPYSAALAA
jgi:hypothetical protein